VDTCNIDLSVLRYREVIDVKNKTLPEIENGISIPDVLKNGNYDKNRKYPVMDLAVGQSFFIPEEQMPSTGSDGVRIACRGQARRHGFKTTTRKVDGGIRVWRVS